MRDAGSAIQVTAAIAAVAATIAATIAAIQRSASSVAKHGASATSGGSAVHESAVHESAVRESAVRESAVRESAVREFIHGSRWRKWQLRGELEWRYRWVSIGEHTFE